MQDRKMTSRNKVSDYLLVIILIVISGNPLAIYSSEWIYAGYLVILLLYLTLKKALFISGYCAKWLLGFAALFFLQLIFIRPVSLPADVNFLAKILIAYFSVRLCGDRFCETYTKVMYYICFVSLIFFIIFCLRIPVPGIHFDRYISLGIWNYLLSRSVPIYRNCGMFWEPGAFQGFIMLPFLFYIGKLEWFWKYHRRKIIVFLLAIISTLSTTAYLVAFAYAFMLLMLSKVKISYKAFLLVCAVGVAVYSFVSIDFMGAKIQEEVETTKLNGTDQVSWSRTGAMLIDFVNIARHPFVGNGFMMDSRYDGLGEAMAGSGNGLTGAVNMLGIPMVMAYVLGIRYVWRDIRRAYGLIVVTIIAMLLFGEYFLNYPLFWGLLFISLPYPKRRNARRSVSFEK